MKDVPDYSLPDWRLASVPAEPMGLWCAAMRDDNAIHVDPAAAEALGFGPRMVNPGPINLAYLINMALAARPGARIASIDAALLGNVLSGDAVIARAHLDAGPDADGALAAELVVEAQDNHPERAVLAARIVLDTEESGR